MPIWPIWPSFEVNGLNWHCCLASSSKRAHRILIFSIAMGAEYSSYVKSIATFALTFFRYIILVLASVGRVGFCSTTAAIKVLFILVSLLLLVLFLQNMFYAVYAKFNLHEIRLVHQQSSWNEKPAKMVELHQMTSNLNESQRLRRITLQLSFTHYIFQPCKVHIF